MGVIATLRGRIEARYLVVFRASPGCLTAHLPDGLRPALHHGMAAVSLCYTRLESSRPRLFARRAGGHTEHLAWRIRSLRDEPGGPQTVVWIPRRHTSSWLNAHAGLLTGAGYSHAHFENRTAQGGLHLSVRTKREEVLYVEADCHGELRGSMFATARQAREFLDDSGAVEPPDPLAPALDRLGFGDGEWILEPLQAREVRAPRLEDGQLFGPGSVEFDSLFRLSRTCRSFAPARAERAVLEDFESSAALP